MGWVGVAVGRRTPAEKERNEARVAEALALGFMPMVSLVNVGPLGQR